MTYNLATLYAKFDGSKYEDLCSLEDLISSYQNGIDEECISYVETGLTLFTEEEFSFLADHFCVR